jgi:glutaredoxin
MATIVYVKSSCPHCVAVLHALAADGVRAIVYDIDVERHVIPELLKLTDGRRVVPVIVEGARVRVAPEGGTPF